MFHIRGRLTAYSGRCAVFWKSLSVSVMSATMTSLLGKISFNYSLFSFDLFIVHFTIAVTRCDKIVRSYSFPMTATIKR